jgi:hypothetical protein
MKKTCIFSLLLTLSLVAFAAPVSLETAQQVSQSFFTNNPRGILRHLAAMPQVLTRVAYSSNAAQQSDAPFYIFNRNTGGFVMVAGDDAAMPILGYSETGSFDAAAMPANLRWWLEEYSTQIAFIRASKLSADSETLQLWNDYLYGNLQQNAPAAPAAVAPLLTTTWDQSSYYNQLCPSDMPTGCVATAVAQIMKYHNHPVQGVGSHTYTHPTFGTLSANFAATTYQWTNMPNALLTSSSPAEKTAVATLMYHLGVATNMEYASSGSGTSGWEAFLALKNHFNYDVGMQLLYCEDYTNSAWVNLVKEELNASRPVYYAGDDGENGHAFVCDGYDNNNYFHINWGWGGYYDGYFLLSALKPEGQGIGGNQGGYNNNQEIITGIQPALSEHTLALTCPELSVNGTLATGSTGNFTITLKNAGTAAYNSYLTLLIYNHENNNEQTIFETDKQFVGAGKTITLSPSANITLPDGNYDMYLYYYPGSGQYLDFLAVSTVTIRSGTDIEKVDASFAPIAIYPNPAVDELRIESRYLKINRAEIFDLTGKKIVNCKLSNNNSIDVSVLPSGIYFVQLETENGVKTLRFSKK